MLSPKQVTIRGDEVLLVRGAANVRLVAGSGHVLGMALSAAAPLIVRAGKILPVETRGSAATFQVQLGSTGECLTLQNGVGTQMWDAAVQTVIRERYQRVLVAGEADVGKSTFTAFLANRGRAGGRRVVVVDGDVGQADLAPPGVIGAARIDEPLTDLRDVTGEAFEVIGTTSPRGVERFVAEGLRRACQWAEASPVDLVIVNTDGYVRDEGAAYKRGLIRAVRADAVVVLGGDDAAELEAEVRGTLDPPPLFSLPRPTEAGKTRLEREQRRMSQYLRFLRHGQRHKIDWSGLDWVLFGTAFAAPRQLAASELLATRTSHSEDARLELRDEVEPWLAIEERRHHRFSLTYGALRSMYVGLGRSRTVTGFGVLLPRGPHHAELWTPVRGYDTLWLTGIRVWPTARREELTPILTLGAAPPSS